MDQEKNLNEEITETAQEVVEEVAEAVEETVEAAAEVVEEAVEEIEEKVRPVVYDDFSEEATEVSEAPAKKEKKGLGFGALAFSTIISSVISVVVTLLILFFINTVPQWVFSAQLQGVWDFNGLYTIVDGKDFTLVLSDPQTQQSQYVEFTYEVEENGVIKLTDKDDTNGGMMAQNLFGTNKLEIETEKDTITFMGMTWNKVDKETAKSVTDSFNAENAQQETVDITQSEE